jgi:integral membrane protein
MTKTDKNTRNFITIAHAEGISYIILLFIAMPLKYFLNIPEAVRYVGLLHGLLFVLFGFYWLNSWFLLKWKVKQAAIIFLLSLVPFGTFYIKRFV